MTHRIFWIVALSLLSGTLARYEDCEVAPTVNFATVRIEDEEDSVRAIYACNSGYVLEGETEIICDLNTDEWNNDPPTCRKIKSEEDTDEDTEGNEENNDVIEPNNSHQKKKVAQDIAEDQYVTDEYAESLDMTCVSARVKAPEIVNGFVQKYDRRRKGEHIFIVAFYSCNDNFELEYAERNAVYCSKKKWIGQLPNCIPLGDYEEEDYDGYDDGGEDVDEEEPKPVVVPQPTETTTSTQPEYNVNVSEEVPDVATTTTEAITEVNVVAQPTNDPYSPRVLNQSCGPDKGGCDHNCETVLYPGENEPRTVCTCYTGFTLDPYDYRRCHDINECDINNGGCEQVCKNAPGSFECACEDGLQIDTVTGNTCIDVNECLLRNGHGPCQDTCHNTWGSYTCSCDGLPGTKLSADNISCEDDGECAINNGGCSHICLATLGRVFCLCPSGFVLSKDWKNCQDINECESAEIAERCPGGCENSHGSYICHSRQPTEETRSNEVEAETETSSEPPRPQQTLECEEGFRLTPDGNCVDIDECTEGIARCENCRNTHGSYDCTCPSGYELSEDETSCVDINECEAYSNQEEGEESETPYRLCSHECENTAGSFVCKCSGNFHIEADRRTCVQDTCEDLKNPEHNKTQCSYYCEDSAEGPVCKCPEQFVLAGDQHTCVHSPSDACQEMGGNERCFPGSCVNSDEGSYKCSCPAGFKDEVYFCKDIDECSEGTHNCSHICFNTEGSFVCSCPIGFTELNGDSSTCRDIDECVEKPGVCGDKACRNTDGGFDCICSDGREPDGNGECVSYDLCSGNNGGCSHECYSSDGRVQCRCPADMTLAEDSFTCVYHDACANNKNGCSQICNSQLQGSCSCEAGYELQEDGKTCRDYDECIDNNGGCEHICVNQPGGYECLCKRGFMLLIDGCFDIDECALDSHNCPAGLLCQNLNGSYACLCPQGFAFAGNSSTECYDVDECSENNGNCSDICINLRGSFQCSCPPGQVLTDDEKTCDLLDECLIDNGGCSHTCVFSKPLKTCACPYGYALGVDAKTCVDVDECSMGISKCSHVCVNEVGSFSCACPEGYALASNGRDCFDADECVDNNGNCSNICINLLGSFSCACEAGFELKEDLRTCTDVDECAQSLHDCSHYCVNVIGTYECSCPAGFVLGPNKLTCSDVDECAAYSSCSHNCRNTLGSFECECPPGMTLDADKKTCVDGDFCNRLKPQCSHYCENIGEGFQCACPSGLSLGSDSLTCVDVNECVVDNGGCSHTCTNTEGSYSCLCSAGSKLGEDGKTCQDINECDVENGGCAHYCINTKGGHSCECSEGYALQDDGFNCVESDPCRRNNGGCEQLCVAARAGVKCACRPGYVLNILDNSSCADIDECQTENICPQQSCRNTPGSYECECQQGFTKNAYGQCVDINECEYQNGGCPGECINLLGSFECKCARGLRLSDDKKSCVQVRDQCQPFRPPKYGEIHCTRSRHKTQLYYKTKCSVWCVPGYNLEGPAIRQCSASGQWDNFENRCVPQLCPRLPRAEHGTILPANCLLGKTYVGERCMLHCNPGYVPAGKKVTVCNANQMWSYNSTFDCIPLGTAISSAPRLGVATHRLGGFPRTDGTRTYIKCPRNTTVLLPSGHKTAHIILQKPKTNLDYRYIESFPAWSRNLEAHLGAGVHVITFRGREPGSRRGAACRTVITVKGTQPPRVAFCPPSFEVSLATNQERRSIAWKEPQFQSDSQIKNIHKSNIPGQLFGEGVHRISYEANDVDGLKARCEFNVVVKAPQVQSLPYTYNYPQVEGRSAKLLANHDSYIICGGQAPVKVFGNQAINLPPGCVIKNVRVNPLRQFLRRSFISQRWSPFRNY